MVASPRRSSSKKMIRFLNVGKSFPGGRSALKDVSFNLERGEFAFLSGASGAGKTTLLKLIYREIEPSSGQILVNGRNVASIPSAKVPFLRRSIGVVFQDFRLIPRKTVLENVSYLPRILGMRQQERKRLAYNTLRRVGLAHRMSAFPAELSGGEQQRVTIARALINRPEILIADEPTGNLDPELSWETLRLFLEINGKGTTVLLATHEHGYVRALGGRTLVLDRGRLVKDEYLEGHVGDIDSASAEDVEDPARQPTGRTA
jgi:cell division transport system ATP-binding protein